MTLIKMSSFKNKVSTQLSPEDYVVGLDGKNFKIKIKELRNFFGIGTNVAFKGIAKPGQDPGVQTTPVFWLATDPGVYTNFGGVVVSPSAFAIIAWNGLTYEVTETIIDFTNYYTKAVIDGKINEIISLTPVTVVEEYLPEDKTGDAFPAQWVNPSSLWGYYSAKINAAAPLVKLYVIAAEINTFNVEFLKIVAGVASGVLYSKKLAPYVVGKNEFTAEDIELPDNFYIDNPGDIQVMITNTATSSAISYSTPTGTDAFTTGLSGGVITPTPNLDFSYWIGVDNGGELFNKIDLFTQISEFDITGKEVFVPREKANVGYAPKANKDQFWGDVAVKVGVGKELIEFCVISPTAGNINICFATLVGTASILYQTTIAGIAGINKYTPTDLGMPDFINNVPDVYILAANPPGLPGGVNVVSYKSIATNDAIFFTIATGVVGTGLYDISVYAKIIDKSNPLIDTIKKLQASQNSGVTINNQADLQDYINSTRNVFLGACNVAITTPLTIPAGTKISGVRGATVLKLSGAGNIVNLDGSSIDITFEDVTFDGNTPIAPAAVTRAIILARTGMGTNMGIYTNGFAKNIHIRGCEFKNFNGAGLNLFRTHQLYVKTFKVTDNIFTNCFMGMLSDVRSEYHSFVGNSFCYNRIGAFIEGGNNFGSANQFNANGVGLVVSGTMAENDSHGSMGDCSFNHNQSFSMYLINVNNGFTFAGCHIFDGNICFDNCKGIVYTGGIMACEIIIVNANGSYNNISNNMFFLGSYGSGTITGDKTKFQMAGNRFIGGEASAAINNEV